MEYEHETPPLLSFFLGRLILELKNAHFLSLTLGELKGSRPPARREDPAAREHLIEQRIQREKPCRTLFIRNVKASGPAADFESNFLRSTGVAHDRHDSMRRTVTLFEECLRNMERSRRSLISYLAEEWSSSHM
jgi:hypothetical protein